MSMSKSHKYYSKKERNKTQNESLLHCSAYRKLQNRQAFTVEIWAVALCAVDVMQCD